MPPLDPLHAHILAGGDSGLTDAELHAYNGAHAADMLGIDPNSDAALGIEAPAYDNTPEQDFNATPLDAFLEKFAAGGLPAGLAAPRGFGQGLVSGVARGAIGQGQEVADRRKKFEAAQLVRQAQKDRANLEATQKYRDARGTALRDKIKADRDAKDKQAVYERDNPLVTPEVAAQQPELGRLVGQRVPQAWLKPTASAQQLQDEAFARTKGANLADSQFPKPATTAPADEVKLSPDALDALVKLRIAGGPDPSFGMGKAGVANKVNYYNRLGQMMSGKNPTEILANKANVKAEGENIAKLTAQRGFLASYGEMVNKNADTMLGTIDKIPDTGIPAFNGLIRPAMEHFLGNADISAFNAAIEASRTEFARILGSGITGGGVLTDSQKKDVRAVLGNNFTRKQLKSAVRILKIDARNRVTTNEDAIAQSQARLLGIGNTPAPGSPESRITTKPATLRWNPATGKVEPIGGR